jgi:hypothetical protein
MAHWYDKYLKKDKKEGKKSYHSSFWSDEFDFDADDYKSVLSEAQIDTLKKYRLSSGRKAISNFVTIATGKQIPVRFSTGKESYTDGKSVVISGDIDDETKFDVGVGLALHEGSHILLSDFSLLGNLLQHIPKSLFDKAVNKGISSGESLSTIKTILNVVEDRRIDNFIYQNAPGYREYYLKLYDQYFGDKVIVEALKSEWNEETVDSYINRLINIMNPASDLTTLTGFRKIWGLLDLHNIGRLKSTKECLDVSLQIFETILDNIQAPGPFKKNDPKAQQGEAGESGEGEGNGESNGEGESGGGEESGKSAGSPDIDVDGGDEDGDSDGSSASASGVGKDDKGKQVGKDSLTPAKQKKLQQTINKQKDFLNGETKKKKISQAMAKEIASVESSGAELQHVADGMKDRWGNPTKGCDVVVLKQLTKQMLDNGDVGLYRVYNKTPRLAISADKVAIAERMGTILGKKLQVRNEARTTVFNRQRNGSIDKRLIHSLGFEAESVFTQLHIDKFKKANIHLSIDASSSMAGGKWDKTMINTIALAKAVSMIQNLSMQISFRYTNESLPVVLIAWDSRKESYQKVRSIFPYLDANGTTPEGLAFEAIRKLIIPATNDMDSYFVNISDGEPCFNGKSFEYQGQPAFEHTKKEVEKFRKDGLIVLSYFVSDRKNGRETYGGECFFKMYGKDARYIDINSVNEVSSTLNKMFLAK